MAGMSHSSGKGDRELGLGHGQVRIAKPHSRWVALFEEESERLSGALHAFGPAVEHCGSTSVKNLPAKPILDILVGVPAPLDVPSIRAALAPLGYEHATWAGVPGHEVFGRGQPRTHLVHVVPLHGPAWERMLRFRDALRGNAALAAEYTELKRKLAVRHRDDRAAYTDGKTAFVERVLASH